MGGAGPGIGLNVDVRFMLFVPKEYVIPQGQFRSKGCGQVMHRLFVGMSIAQTDLEITGQRVVMQTLRGVRMVTQTGDSDRPSPPVTPGEYHAECGDQGLVQVIECEGFAESSEDQRHRQRDHTGKPARPVQRGQSHSLVSVIPSLVTANARRRETRRRESFRSSDDSPAGRRVSSLGTGSLVHEWRARSCLVLVHSRSLGSIPDPVDTGPGHLAVGGWCVGFAWGSLSFRYRLKKGQGSRTAPASALPHVRV